MFAVAVARADLMSAEEAALRGDREPVVKEGEREKAAHEWLPLAARAARAK